MKERDEQRLAQDMVVFAAVVKFPKKVDLAEAVGPLLTVELAVPTSVGIAEKCDDTTETIDEDIASREAEVDGADALAIGAVVVASAIESEVVLRSAMDSVVEEASDEGAEEEVETTTSGILEVVLLKAEGEEDWPPGWFP